MLVSVAVSVVTSEAWRGSPGAVLQVVFQLRAVTACPVRPIPGYCSQHEVVEYERPPPVIVSSPNWSVITTGVALSPPPLGRGPHAAPHSPMIQRTVSGDADQRPASVRESSASAFGAKLASAASETAAIASARTRALTTTRG